MDIKTKTTSCECVFPSHNNDISTYEHYEGTQYELVYQLNHVNNYNNVFTKREHKNWWVIM